jgi:primosomal protein N' (replication factor Y)
MVPTVASFRTQKTKRFRVLLPFGLGRAYDYRAAEELAIGIGDVVMVPLGPREVYGVVWQTVTGEGPDAIAEGRLRDIIGRLDVPPLQEPLRRFIDWVAAYTLSAPGSVLRMAVSVRSALVAPTPRRGLIASGEPPPRMTLARTQALAAVDAQHPRTRAELARDAGVSSAIIQGLVTAGALAEVELPEDFTPAAGGETSGLAPKLTEAQRRAADRLTAHIRHGGFAASVLDGVTGSGKTEVYFEAIAEALARGQQCLVLLPEIALTAQWLRRFRTRFGMRPTEWHSDLKQTQRRRNWRSVAFGGSRIVVGARSSLFLPFRELGLIVVDEEHDTAFKQEDGVMYNARDMAVVRASIGDFPIILASATPSLETLVNIDRERYERLELPDRIGRANLPEIAAVDMRDEKLPATKWISGALSQALTDNFAAGEQSMLFLNRRGYAPLTLCRECGDRMSCPNCSTWLVDHRLTRQLQCHHCGFTVPKPDVCSACGAAGAFAACGPGVERVAEEVAELLPEARLAIMASDTISSPTQAAEFIDQMENHEIDILVGTQIVAKGHHFPMLTLVGVVDADLGLTGGDLRAAERTYQLLAQVSGRAGRAEHPGRVLLQTYGPEHPVMQALISGQRDRFIASETAERQHFNLPPFGRLAAIIVSAPDERRALEVCAALANSIPADLDGARILGPAPAPLFLLRGRYRHRFLVMAERHVNVQNLLSRWLGDYTPPRHARIQVDIDPYSFL